MAATRPPSSPEPSSRPSWAWLVVLAVIAGLWLIPSTMGTSAHPEVEYSTLLQWVRAGKVKDVVLRPGEVSGTLSKPETVDGKPVTAFRTAVPHDERLVALSMTRASRSTSTTRTRRCWCAC